MHPPNCVYAYVCVCVFVYMGEALEGDYELPAGKSD